MVAKEMVARMPVERPTRQKTQGKLVVLISKDIRHTGKAMALTAMSHRRTSRRLPASLTVQVSDEDEPIRTLAIHPAEMPSP